MYQWTFLEPSFIISTHQTGKKIYHDSPIFLRLLLDLMDFPKFLGLQTPTTLGSLAFL